MGQPNIEADPRRFNWIGATSLPGRVCVDWHTAPDAPFTTNAEAAGITPLPGALTGDGNLVLLDPAQNNSFRVLNRALGVSAEVLLGVPDEHFVEGESHCIRCVSS